MSNNLNILPCIETCGLIKYGLGIKSNRDDITLINFIT